MIIDSSEVGTLAADLGKAGAAGVDEATKVVKKGAHNIKTDSARRITGLAHAPAYPAAITYDVTFGWGTITAEIGPDKGRRQGALGNILEYGTVKNPPHPHLGPALDAEEPKYLAAIEDAAVKALGL